MEKLREYLSKAQKKQNKFAEEIGVSAPYLSQILTGQRRPSLGVVARISVATGNEIELSDWSDILGLNVDAKLQTPSLGGAEV